MMSNNINITATTPLTLKQLRAMNGEPVYVQVIDHTVFKDPADDFDGWGLCRQSWVRLWDMNRCDVISVVHDFSDYGKTWLAYSYQTVIDRLLSGQKGAVPMHYRYITCGLVFPDDHVAQFRLIAGRNLDGAEIVIRIKLPDNIRLRKYSCDTYSTCDDDHLLIKDCSPTLMVRINQTLRPMPGIWPEYQPNEIHHELQKRGFVYDFHAKSYKQAMISPKSVQKLLDNL